jgi:hypothetical protein
MSEEQGSFTPEMLAAEPPDDDAQKPSPQGRLGESDQKPDVPRGTNGDQDKKPEPKPLSRYERTKRQKAQIAQREAILQQREAALAHKERAQTQAQQKPKRNYTIGDLKTYRSQWEAEGNFDLVEKADKEIAVMEAEEKASKNIVEVPRLGTPQHEAQWHQAEAELAKADPEFMRSGTPLDTKLREIMGGPDGDIYRGHPRGIVAAYHRARMELLEAERTDLRTKLAKIEEENKRLNGLTSVGGGAPGRVGTGGRVETLNDFAKLKSSDMRKHLLSNAGRGEMPWL